MLVVERVSATLEVASALNVRTGESVFHSVCVHLEDGVPIQLEDRFVNPQVVPDFAQQDFSQQQPSEFLVRTVPFDEIEHVVDAVLPTMDALEPCLLLTRRTWTNGVPVTLVRCLHPASRYRLGSRYSANGNPIST
jgi:GntR family histidine utilization transcriptional repressor